MMQYEITGGSASREAQQVNDLRARVNQGHITPQEAAQGPIISPNHLNHAHKRKTRVKAPEQLPLL